MSKKINIQIKGIHCKSCKALIESEIKVLDGIKNINVDSESGASTIEYDQDKISQNTIFKAIKKLKYGAQKTGEDKEAINTKLNFKTASIVGVAIFAIIIGGVSIMLMNSSGADTKVKNYENTETVIKTVEKKQPVAVNDGFLGDRGDTLNPQGGKLVIAEAGVSDGNLHSYNYYSEKAGKNIYFFVLKAPDGTYRAAANACEVCYGAKKGFTQVGDLIRCENCQQSYAKEKIAMEKGGCNPGPIDNNVEINGEQLTINVSDVEAVAYLF